MKRPMEGIPKTNPSRASLGNSSDLVPLSDYLSKLCTNDIYWLLLARARFRSLLNRAQTEDAELIRTYLPEAQKFLTAFDAYLRDRRPNATKKD